MKGLTLLWMCLCCLRPDEVAKVLPQSGQAWALAPTCWERMCLCRLLGSVNTCWGGGKEKRTQTRRGVSICTPPEPAWMDEGDQGNMKAVEVEGNQ